jgi:hypothetical protein
MSAAGTDKSGRRRLIRTLVLTAVTSVGVTDNQSKRVASDVSMLSFDAVGYSIVSEYCNVLQYPILGEYWPNVFFFGLTCTFCG